MMPYISYELKRMTTHIIHTFKTLRGYAILMEFQNQYELNYVHFRKRILMEWNIEIIHQNVINSVKKDH